MSTADQLVERQHYAADEIEARCAALQENWAELTSLSAARQQSLQDSLKAQQVGRNIRDNKCQNGSLNLSLNTLLEN